MRWRMRRHFGSGVPSGGPSSCCACLEWPDIKGPLFSGSIMTEIMLARTQTESGIRICAHHHQKNKRKTSRTVRACVCSNTMSARVRLCKCCFWSPASGFGAGGWKRVGHGPTRVRRALIDQSRNRAGRTAKTAPRSLFPKLGRVSA